MQESYSLSELRLEDVDLPDDVGFIYFLGAPPDFDPIKIGRTVRLSGRFSAYRSHSPVELHLLALAKAIRPWDIERSIHWALRESRLHGEWFMSSDVLRGLVEEYCYVPDGPIRQFPEDWGWGRSSHKRKAPTPRQRASAARRSAKESRKAFSASRHGVRHIERYSAAPEDTPYQRAREAQRVAELLEV